MENKELDVLKFCKVSLAPTSDSKPFLSSSPLESSQNSQPQTNVFCLSDYSSQKEIPPTLGSSKSTHLEQQFHKQYLSLILSAFWYFLFFLLGVIILNDTINCFLVETHKLLSWPLTGCQLQFKKYCPEQCWNRLYPFLDMKPPWKLAKLCINVIAHADRLVFLKHEWKYFFAAALLTWAFPDDLLGLMCPPARSSKALLKMGLLMFPLARSKFTGLSRTSSLWLGR